MYRLKFAVCLTLFTVFLISLNPWLSVSAGTGFPIVLKDQFNRKVRINREPKRIVSGSPGNTEILFTLGLQRKIVGVTNWCNYPEQTRQITKIGDITPLNVEKVLDLHPDLVVADVLNGKEAITRLAGFGIPAFALNANSISEILTSITLIGRITGKNAAARNLANRLQNTLNQVRKQGLKLKSRCLKVYIVLGWKPNWTAGPGSFLDEAVTLAGANNIACDLHSPWGQMSMELVMKRNPDVIITDIPPRKIYSNPLWTKIAAIQKHQVYQIAADQYYRPGPRLIEALTDLSAKLNACH